MILLFPVVLVAVVLAAYDRLAARRQRRRLEACARVPAGRGVVPPGVRR